MFELRHNDNTEVAADLDELARLCNNIDGSAGGQTAYYFRNADGSVRELTTEENDELAHLCNHYQEQQL